MYFEIDLLTIFIYDFFVCLALMLFMDFYDKMFLHVQTKLRVRILLKTCSLLQQIENNIHKGKNIDDPDVCKMSTDFKTKIN